MRGELDKAVAIGAVILVGAAGITLAADNGILATGQRIAIYVAANLILIFDMLDLMVRIWLMHANRAVARGPSLDLALPDISKAERITNLNPYAIIASVHDAADQIDRFTTTLRPFKDVVWLIDDASHDATLLRLRREGWHCLAGGVNRKKPGAIRHLLRSLPPEIQTVVVLDPDIRWKPAGEPPRAVLERVISDLQRSGAAAFTPRILAKRRGWLTRFQALEYELACGLGRKSLRDLSCNSGVSVYRRAALEAALAKHSLSVYAEDFENSILLLSAGKRVYYDDRLLIETDASPTLGALFSQRVGWSFGCAKLYLERIKPLLRISLRSPLGAYQYLFYLGINGILLFPLKLLSIGILAMSFLRSLDDLLLTDLMPHHVWNEPLLFALWYAKSTVVLLIGCIVALPRGDRRPHLLTVLFYGPYALAQYLPMSVGYANVISLRLFGRRIYRDHYDADPHLRSLTPVEA